MVLLKCSLRKREIQSVLLNKIKTQMMKDKTHIDCTYFGKHPFEHYPIKL